MTIFPNFRYKSGYVLKKRRHSSSMPLYNERAKLALFMGGRAAEGIFFGEENVKTGATSDMRKARNIARAIGRS